MAETVAIGFFLGSLIIALSGIVAHQKTRALQTEIDRLRRDLNALTLSEQRRFMRELEEQSASIVSKSANGLSVEGDEIRADPEPPQKEANSLRFKKADRRNDPREVLGMVLGFVLVFAGVLTVGSAIYFSRLAP